MRAGWFHKKLSCPSCGRSLAASRSGALSCRECSISFPVFDGIPWLFADPDGALAEWKDRYDLYLAKLKEEVKELQDSMRHLTRPPSTTIRLKNLLEGKRGQIRLIKRILAPLRALPEKPKEVHHAFRDLTAGQPDPHDLLQQPASGLELGG
jgi:uncharacterized protein YbaR (Trm112 family)